jgi:hypothetical protein
MGYIWWYSKCDTSFNYRLKLESKVERQESKVANEQVRVDLALQNATRNNLKKRRIAYATSDGASIEPKVLEYLWIQVLVACSLTFRLVEVP